MNRTVFFDSIRETLFGGRLSADQVRGVNRILDAFDQMKIKPLSWRSYIMATDWWETGKKMMPVREIGKGRGRSYGKADKATGQTYYGRGDVQLTWKANYQKMGKKLGLDLVNDPDLALHPDISAQIMIVGMRDGMFTGKALKDFLPATGGGSYREARAIVNGTDKAAEIANAARKFEAAFVIAEAAPARQPDDPGVDPSDAPPKRSLVKIIVTAIIALIMGVAGYFLGG